MGHSSRSSSTSKKPFQTFKTFTPSQLTTSTTRMKYVFAILVIACALAAAKKCPSKRDIKEAFDQVDTNHNGQIDGKELVAALIAYAKHEHYTPTLADVEWIQKTAKKDAGKDHQLNMAEFGKFANSFAAHFHLC